MDMVGSSSWIEGNWFNIIQTAGIIGSLVMTAAAARANAKSREIQNFIKLTNQHRKLWDQAKQQPELQRIFQADANVLETPETTAESLFLNDVFIHFQSNWQMAPAGGFVSKKDLASDIRGFFSLPLPRAVWEKTKNFRNRRFVNFVELALRKHTPAHVEQV